VRPEFRTSSSNSRIRNSSILSAHRRITSRRPQSGAGIRCVSGQTRDGTSASSWSTVNLASPLEC
jgi:hypothetical protein